MQNTLDRLLAELGKQPLDRDLTALEVDVQQRIAGPGIAWFSGAPIRMAMVSMALVLGVGIGGLTAANSVAYPRQSLFAATDALAPSTLLDGGR